MRKMMIKYMLIAYLTIKLQQNLLIPTNVRIESTFSTCRVMALYLVGVPKISRGPYTWLKSFQGRIGVTMTSTQITISRRMQWFFLIVISLWILAAMALPILAFCITKNPMCLSGFSTLAPPIYILYRIAAYLFPKDDRYYKLAEVKAKYSAGQRKKEQVSQ